MSPVKCTAADKAEQCANDKARFQKLQSWGLYTNDGQTELRFNASKFLRCMRNRHLAIVGDSVARGHYNHLVCHLERLGKLEKISMLNLPAMKDGDEKGKQLREKWNLTATGGLLSFKGEYNFTLTFYDEKTPWMANRTFDSGYYIDEKSGLQRKNGQPPMIDPESEGTRYMAAIGRPAFRQGADVIMISYGNHYKRDRIYRANSTLDPSVDEVIAKMTAAGVRHDLDKQLAEHPNTHVLWRSFAPQHFTNGDWDTGGVCGGRTRLRAQDGMVLPIWKGGYLYKAWLHHSTQRDFGPLKSAFPKRMRFLDVTDMSWERGDAHLEKERLFGNVSDCSHYCSVATDGWSLLMQHAMCNGDEFEFQGTECDASTLKSVPGRTFEAALDAAVAKRYSTVQTGSCPSQERDDADAGGAGVQYIRP